jgi:DNA-binding NarL/FixJ family response regulator
MANDDIRAIINKYLPESVRLREPPAPSRPKVRAPQAQARSKVHPDASACIPTHPAGAGERSKPFCPSTLSPRQLAAARALAAGKRVCDVAAQLRINRTTLLRWRKLTDFTDELQRIHMRNSEI